MPNRCSATTAKGEPCRGSAIEGSTLCMAHIGRNGRKTTLTEATTNHLAQLLKAGNYLQVAVSAAGVPLSTFTLWWKRGDPDKADPADELYRDFRERMDRARAEGEARNVALIAAAGPDNWQAAAWMLERSYPERWARPSQREKPETPETPVKPNDPFAEVDELAERRRNGIT
jgi:hypothetical protein